MSLEEIREERIKKLRNLKEVKIDPYPAKTSRKYFVSDVLKKFTSFVKTKKKIGIAGRIMAKREHGGSAFFDLKDGSESVQIYFKKDILAENYDLALEVIDIGDFVGVEGKCFKTKRGENTIEVVRWSMLAKSLLPLPEKWHGLQDVEERFRKRHLDLLMNPEVRDRFISRSKIINSIRGFFDKNGFLEVETPVLQPIPGGALARPFITHHNALDSDFYLRVAPELYLKRLLVGGLEKIYEIGKNFRNEGIDVSHNPEFTELECYVAYWDENNMMSLVEDLFVAFARIFGKKGEIEFGGKSIKFKKQFSRIYFKDLLSRYALISDYERETRDSMAVKARQLGIEVSKHESKGKIADEIYKKICRPYLVQPTFIVNHPLDISPLAKVRSEKTDEVRRFQLIVSGLEIANGFSELNDPMEQRRRFEEQEKMRSEPPGQAGRASPTDVDGGDEEAHRMDEEFIEALEYGMPPSAGLGIGIDRVVMLFTNTKNIREAVLFPTMRSRKGN